MIAFIWNHQQITLKHLYEDARNYVICLKIMFTVCLKNFMRGGISTYQAFLRFMVLFGLV